MNYKKYMFTLAACLLLSLSSYAYKTPESERPVTSTNSSGIPVADIRTDCARSASQIDQAINNVRARLHTGGDVWWDRSNGRYVVPKVPQGQVEVSSIFAGAVWLGGRDDGGNLKVACQTYGPGTDFWPGPLDEQAEISEEDCRIWDKFFVVTGEDVRQHAANFAAAQEAGIPYDPNDIPESIKGWPALGNEFFEEIHGFRLPFDEANGLAGFWDYGDNGVRDLRYNPELGDFPIVEIRECDAFPVTFPDEMIFWIYNDKGNLHGETNADAIGMEVQVQAFAFQSDDEINNMTFQRYKLINRAVEPINETYFAMWVDGDLGCFDDDYIGCDTTRSLAYYYNADAEDGDNGSCAQGTPIYDPVPAVGIDYFRGPLDENFQEIGMSSFTYYNNNGIGGPWPQGTVDPGTGEEYYNYLSGNWRDGTPFSLGGSGYDPGNPNVVDYAFVNPPDLSGGWSMCEEMSPQGDRRTIQASGPFTLLPGAKNELIVGVVWIEELNYPCPNINNLLQIDDVAQSLFDNCFEITRGPSAPDVDFVELDKELVCILTNDPGNANNNNIYENYQEKDLRAPADGPEFLYRFEGYQIYQLAGPTSTNLEDPDQARIIREMDLRNGVSSVYNWVPVENPLDANNAVWTPVLEAEGSDEGIQHTFLIAEDQFATGDRSLINHKTYYYTAIAYGYNNWEPFRVENGVPLGQRSPYISGDLNIRTYTPVPRPLNNTNLNTFYGEGVELERLEGKGNGGYFVELTDESFATTFDGSDENLVYKAGQGPVDIKIINPLEVVDGTYELTFSDGSMDDSDLSPTTRWVLKNLDNGDVFESEKPIDTTYEQIIQELGISVTIGTPPTVGDLTTEDNGAIGAELEYKDGGENAWFFGLSGNEQGATFINQDDGKDPNGSLTGPIMQPSGFVPFILTRPPSGTSVSPMIEDNAIFSLVNQATDLTDLNNVDIVFTSDKSKWSRCMIIETSTEELRSANLANWPTEGGAKHFELRDAPSVTKEADDNGMPKEDTGASRRGFGYFPGYAIDVETGDRLNIFFGEASSYDCEALTAGGQGDFCVNFLNGENGTGRDMMWNPTPQQTLLTALPFQNIATGILGGHHWIYVTRTKYDGCEELADAFESSNPITRRNGLAEITWTSAAIPFNELTSYEEGLIPEDLTYRLRVSKPLGVEKPGADNQGYPKYRFKIEGKSAQPLSSSEEFDEQLAGISIVPNPYYGFSSYETAPTSTLVKFTNLPNECEINIFSLEGKFIRSYSRNVGPNAELSRGGVVAAQQTASIDWDLKNSKGIPVASGTYLVHVNAPGIGERTLKLFMVQRQFDPSGL